MLTQNEKSSGAVSFDELQIQQAGAPVEIKEEVNVRIRVFVSWAG